jgi:lysophospholipase L1-like esterase
MVATLPPQRLGGPKTAPPELLEKFNRDLRLMASKKGAQLIDVNALLPVSLIGQDGLHPTEEGDQELAEIFFDAIKARYEAPASTARR